MDPNTTWRLLLQAVARGEGSDPRKTDDAFEHASNLENWLARGGFKPDELDFALMRRARNGTCRESAGDRKLAADILERLNA